MTGSHRLLMIFGRLRGFAGAVVFAAGFIALTGMTTVAQARGPEPVADLAGELIDAVVNISTSQKVRGARGIPMPEVPEGSPFREFFEEFFDRQNKNNTPRKVQSLGSGFVIDAAGIVITNNHVIEDADEVIVNFNDGSKLPAEVVGKDKKTDIAVLKVKPEKPLKAVNFGDSQKLRVGDWVMAIGNPFGLGGTVTLGIVSARNRDINAGPYDNFIQTDASINRGNSGGPLFDMDGNVVGINTAIISPSGGSIGIGFAIPAAMARNIIDQLRKFGETRRGWLGVRIQEVTDELAEGLGLEKARGALVAGVTNGGPAEQVGIERGDVIVEFNGQPIKTMSELPRIVADTSVGDKVPVKVLRKGEEIDLTVEIGRLEEAELTAARQTKAEEGVTEKSNSALGMTFSDITPQLRDKFKLSKELKGVVVTAVDENSSAAEKQMKVGEVIVEVAQEEVTAPKQVVERVEKLKSGGRKTALLLVSDKDGELRFVAIGIDG